MSDLAGRDANEVVETTNILETPNERRSKTEQEILMEGFTEPSGQILGITKRVTEAGKKADEIFVEQMKKASEALDPKTRKEIISQTGFFDAISIAEYCGSSKDSKTIDGIREVLSRISNDVTDSYAQCYDERGKPKIHTETDEEKKKKLLDLQNESRDGATKHAVTHAVELIRAIEPGSTQSDAEIRSEVRELLAEVTFQDVLEVTKGLLGSTIEIDDNIAIVDVIPVLKDKKDYFLPRFAALDQSKESKKSSISSDEKKRKRLYALLMAANVAWASSQPHRALIEQKASRVESHPDTPFQNYATLPNEGYEELYLKEKKDLTSEQQGHEDEQKKIQKRALLYATAVLYKDIFELQKFPELLQDPVASLVENHRE